MDTVVTPLATGAALGLAVLTLMTLYPGKPSVEYEDRRRAMEAGEGDGQGGDVGSDGDDGGGGGRPALVANAADDADADAATTTVRRRGQAHSDPHVKALSRALLGTDDNERLQAMYQEAVQEVQRRRDAGEPEQSFSTRSSVRYWSRMLDIAVVGALLVLLTYGLQRDYGVDAVAYAQRLLPREAAVFRRVAADVSSWWHGDSWVPWG